MRGSISAHYSCWPVHLPGTSGHSTGDVRGKRYIFPWFSCDSRESRQSCASLRLRRELRNQRIGICAMGIPNRDDGGYGFVTQFGIRIINSYNAAAADLIGFAH